MSHVLRVGVSDQIAYFRAYNTDGSANTSLTASTAGLSLSVFRIGAGSVSIASLSNKAADNTAHADGAIRNVGGNLYTIDIPDAATATQVPSIVVRGSYTGGVIEGLEHPIVAYDPSLAYQQQIWAAANSTVNLSGTTIKTATDVETDTVDIQSRIPLTLDNGSMRSSVQSMATNVLNAAALATDAVTEIVAGVFNAMPNASWDDGSFGDRLLIGANNNRSILVTGSNHAAADIHDCQTDVIDANALAADAVAEIAAAVGGGTGTGARTVTITVNDGTTPLQNAIVRLSQGVENYVGKTNASGVIVFAVDDATWDVAITKSGYRFTPTTLVVDGTETRTYSMTARAFTPSDADKVTGYWTVLGADGEAAEGVVVTVRAVKTKSGSTGLIHVKTARTATTDSEGVAEFANMLPGWSYSVSLDGETIATVAIASDATDEVELGSCILAE